MTIEQRKKALINWITAIQQEKFIEQIEEFRRNPYLVLPETKLKQGFLEVPLKHQMPPGTKNVLSIQVYP